MSVKQLLTAEDLWAMPEVPGKRFELVDGELVEVPAAGVLHNLIAALLYELIRNFVRERKLGLVFTDGLGYIIGRRPDRTRIPDASFVSRSRIPAGDLPRGFWELAPDLAAEIVSPNDTARELHAKACLRAQRKVLAYLEAGARLVWVVWPDERAVTAYAAGGGYREYGPDDELDGGEVLPGFQVRVAALFDVGR